MSVVPITAHPRFRRHGPTEVGKLQVARELGCSTRWVEILVSRGLPSRLDSRGRRRFNLDAVRRWLDERQEDGDGNSAA